MIELPGEANILTASVIEADGDAESNAWLLIAESKFSSV